MAVAHFVGSDRFAAALLGLTPQALCCRLLRRLKAKVLKHKLMVRANFFAILKILVLTDFVVVAAQPRINTNVHE